MAELNKIQEEIYKAIKKMREKAQFTEFQLAKKIRENTKFEGKKKAGIALDDVLAALECLKGESLFYSIHINQVNECLFKKEEEDKGDLQLEAKQRRHKSEKSMSILTSGDFSASSVNSGKSGKSSAKGHEKRNNRQKLNIRDFYED